MGSRIVEIEDYWSDRAAGYSESVQEQIESGSYKHWLNIFEEHMDGKRELDILDVGCGPGFFPVILGRNGHKVTGIDCTPAMLDRARENCLEYGVEAGFRIMDAQNLEFPDGSFDVVISRNLVWNLEDPGRAY